MDNPHVPKFGSFKPKPAAKPISSVPPNHEDNTKSRDRKRDSGHDFRQIHLGRDNRYDSRRRHPDFSNHCRDDRHRHRGYRHTSPTPEPVIAPDEFKESDLYIIDRRGDAKNVAYGSLHRYSIPSYHATGYGNVIGVPLSAKIDREESNDKEVVLKTSARDGRQRAPRPLAHKQGRTYEQHPRFVVRQSPDGEDSPDADFIQLQPSRKRRQDAEFSAADLAEAATVDYRSIEGKAKQPPQPEDDDRDSASDPGSDDIDEDISLKQREQNAVLSKQAKSSPTQWQPWLALVKHQANLVRPGVDAASFSASERKTLADLRLSILNEASRHIKTSSSAREELLLAVIAEGCLIWDATKVAAKWKEALSECPGSTLLWAKHLDFIQHNHIAFRYETCRDAYVGCLGLLKDARDRSRNDASRIAELQVFVLMRFACFVREAGYDELAIGIWQAILDLHMLRATDDPVSSEDLSSFEKFWESEIPRLGEIGAMGWKASLTADSRRGPARPIPASIDNQHPFASFATQELRFHGFILPATMDDEDATSDPFRCVMFSDIRDVLERLQNPLPKRQLLQAFLIFMGVPFLPIGEDGLDVRVWFLDQHITSATSRPLSDSPIGDIDTPTYYLQTTDSLFQYGVSQPFAKKRVGILSDSEDHAQFMVRILSTLVAADDKDDTLAEYYLAFILHNFPNQAAKIAKQLLKTRPSSLRLYNAYALIQAHLNGLDHARNVWTLVLGMANNRESGLKDDAILLWHSRLHAQLRAGQENAALQALLGLSDPASSSTTDDHICRLKTTRLLEDVIDRMLLSQKFSHAVLGIGCFAWLQYLLQGHNLTSALQVYHKYAQRLSSRASEQLHQTKCAFLQTHIDNKRPYRPATLLAEVDTSLKLFPNNTILLSLHSKLASQDHLRALVRQETAPSSTTSKSLIQWEHRLATEMKHLQSETTGATVNSVRAIFSKTLLSIDSEVNHSPRLWMTWLQFEHKVAVDKGQELDRVKRVFLDGMRYLSWLKHWIVTGMGMLAESSMSKGEMKQVYETMVERGLRVRFDIEDLI